MELPKTVKINEVGPREGFQFEGVGNPNRISTPDKVRLIEALSTTGLTNIQITSFVHPQWVPQMADAEEICRLVTRKPGISFTGVFLNINGFERAQKTGVIDLQGKVTLTASETFSKKNQNRTLEQDLEMQHKMAQIYINHGIPITHGSITAAFGCNYEGLIPMERVLGLIETLLGLSKQYNCTMNTVSLADTMGWANPDQVRRYLKEVRRRWPTLHLMLHLHDTRGLGITNVYAALLEGVDEFDTAVAGLGGCPFAGHAGAAGNVCTEDVLFLCRELGIETGVDIDAMVACARMAEEIVGHSLPGRLKNTGIQKLKASC